MASNTINSTNTIYLDANATTPTSPRALEASLPYFTQYFGNPSSSHVFGKPAGLALERARGQITSLLSSGDAAVIFESCATESITHVVKSLTEGRNTKGGHIITSLTEHVATLEVCAWAERQGVRVTRLSPLPTGSINPSDVLAALTPDTFLITLMLANNETGAITDVGRVAREVRAACASLNYPPPFLHTDASQAVGKIAIDFAALNVDALTLAGHKLYAPKGVGCTVLRKGVHLAPLLLGGCQEGGLRAGTENVPLAVALGEAASLSQAWLAGGGVEVQRALAWKLALRLKELTLPLPSGMNGPLAQAYSEAGSGGERGGSPHPGCLPNTLSIHWLGVKGPSIAAALGGRVAVSTGAACHSGGGGGQQVTSVKSSHVLAAMGVSVEAASGTLRLSLLREAREEELEAAALLIAEAVNSLHPSRHQQPQEKGKGEEGVSSHDNTQQSGEHTALKTTPLFLQDTERYSCEGSKVLSVVRLPHPAFPPLPAALQCVPVGVILDATVAHAQGGGQPGDKGVIVFKGCGLALHFVTVRWGVPPLAGEGICHYGWLVKGGGEGVGEEEAGGAARYADAISTEGPPPPTTTTTICEGVDLEGALATLNDPSRGVACAVHINSPFRRQCAALHSSGHLLDAAVKLALGAVAQSKGLSPPPVLQGGKGNHFPTGPPCVEYTGTLPSGWSGEEFLKEVQAQVDELLRKGEDTRVLALPSKQDLVGAIEGGGVGGMEVEALKGIDLAHFPEGKLLRIVAVGGADNVCPCGGTHVKNARAMAGLKVLKVKSAKGTTKINYEISTT